MSVLTVLVSAGALACATGTNLGVDDEEIVSPTPATSPSSSGRPAPTKPGVPSPSATAPDDAEAPPPVVPPGPSTPDASVPPPVVPPPASSGNAVAGAVSGVSVAVQDGWALVVASGARVTSAAVALQDVPSGCADYGVGRERAGTTKVRIQAYVNPSSAQSVVPGTYSVGSASGVFVDALLSKGDTGCNNMLTGASNKAASGTVTFTAFQPSTKGTFDLTFPGGRLTGSFDAPQCTKNPAGGASCVP